MQTRSSVRVLPGLAALLAALAALLFVPSASGVSGELRVLYVLATWGPLPFSEADAERVAAETDAFVRVSSSGRLSMPGVVAAPLRLPRSVFDSCDATALRDAAPGDMFAGYDRIGFVTPPVPACQFHGEANPTEVLLNGHLFRALAVHELGHTLGLAHASRWNCAGRSCEVDEYGSQFSVMGGADGDFNAFEKAKLEWLTGVVRSDANGIYEIGPVEGSTTLPQALVVTTATGEYWFESRGAPTASFHGGSAQPAGVAVVAGPSNGAITSPYPRENLLLPNPSGRGRFAYAAGESFVRPGVFRLTVQRHAPESAALEFAWLDRVAPRRPVLGVSARRSRVRVSWDPAVERGSGVRTYSLVVDGRVVRTFDGQIAYLNSRATLRLRRGVHRVGVFATDRAGNRGRAAVARVRIK
jgi:hypothetical protein